MPGMDLRPRSATEIVDASFQLLRLHFVELTTLSVAAHLPVLIVRLATAALSPGDSTMVDPSRELLALPLTLLAGLMQFAAPLPTIVAASQVYLGDAYDPRAAVRRAMKRFWTTLAALIMRQILIFLGMFAFLIGGFYVWLRYAPISAVSLLEDSDSSKTASRTWALTRDSAGHVFLVWLPMVFVYLAMLAIGYWMVFTGSGSMLLKHPNEFAVFQTAGSALLYPIISVVTVVLYYDLRTRKEGFDVEMMSRAAAPRT
jgi:hypothetical protein